MCTKGCDRISRLIAEVAAVTDTVSWSHIRETAPDLKTQLEVADRCTGASHDVSCVLSVALKSDRPLSSEVLFVWVRAPRYAGWHGSVIARPQQTWKASPPGDEIAVKLRTKQHKRQRLILVSHHSRKSPIQGRGDPGAPWRF